MTTLVYIAEAEAYHDVTVITRVNVMSSTTLPSLSKKAKGMIMTSLSRKLIAVVLGMASQSLCVAPVSGQGSEDKPKMKIELRWAEDRAIDGVTESTGFDLPESAKKAYLHKDAIVANSDIKATRVRKGNGVGVSTNFFFEVDLNKEASKTMAKSSKENLNKTLVTLVDGKVVAVMGVKGEFADGITFISYFTEAEANRIVAGIQGK